MRVTLLRLQRAFKVQDKYKLLDREIPSPTLITDKTFCECQFPENLPINHDKPLFGTKASTWKHVLVHSKVPATEWAPRVELMPAELISLMNRHKKSTVDPMHPVLFSNVELLEPSVEIAEGTSNVLIYPDNEYFQVSESNVSTFMSETLNPQGTKQSCVGSPNKSRTLLICGHTKRDLRCGIVAPILQEEFTFNLEKRGLLHSDSNPQGVKVGIISHVGGHAYAGNVLYFDEDGISVWYGRVEPKHVDAIVSETIVEKNIIKPLYRGRF